MLLIGCSDNDEPTVQKRDDFKGASKQTEKRLNWIGHWRTEHDRETLVREIKQDFELLNPDIDVNLKFPSQIMGFRSKKEAAKLIVNMIRTGNIEWDVIWLDDRTYRFVADELNDQEWSKKYLVDFEQVPGFKETQKSFIIDDPVYRDQMGGMIIGPYIEGHYHMIYYNKDVAERMGIEIKQDGMTFDDLLGYVRQVYEYNQEHNTGIAAFYEAEEWTTLEILFQHLFKSEFEDFSKAKEEVGSDEKNAALLKTFQAFEELGKHDPLMDSYKDNVWFDTRHLVLNDECLFYVNGTWMYSHWMAMSEEKTKKMIPAELPVFQEVGHYAGTFVSTWAVMKDAPNKEDGIKLLMFWSRPWVAEKWVRYAKSPTGLVGNISFSDIGEDNFARFITKTTDKYGSDVHFSANAGYILGEKNQLLQQDINKKLLRLLDGNITAQQAYDEIMKEVK